MEQRYPIPAATHRTEESIERSRFLTTVGHAPTVEDARTFVDAVRSEFADATHNCWAHVVGPPGDSARVGMSDDGEPHGTAGRPMLAVLLGSGIGDVVAVVTRYYGGRKLGKGGLVRAYAGGVRRTLEELPVDVLVPCHDMRIATDYPFVERIKALVEKLEGEIVEAEYGKRVSLLVRVPVDAKDEFVLTLERTSGGRARIERL